MTCTRLTYGELVKCKPLHITLHIQAYKCQNIDYTHTHGVFMFYEDFPLAL